MKLPLAIAWGAAAALAAGCTTGPLSRLTRPASPHEEYRTTLTRAGLDDTALAADWLRASEAVLHAPSDTSLPFTETGYFPPEDPSAVAYSFAARRGRRLMIEVGVNAVETGSLFVDLFHREATSLERVTSMPEEGNVLDFEIEEDGTYVLRVQAELLRGGEFTVAARTLASLPLPVQGVTARAMQSAFGSARDGGARVHDGIDIFAARGTPVIAVADGSASTGTNGLGGNVVWLRAGRLRYYYAHLDAWAFEGAARVRTGDVLGYVGNTGNAVTTAPHLHFGIYTGRPVDPFPFVRDADPAVPAPALSLPLDTMARVNVSRVSMRQGATADATVIRPLERGTLVSVRGGSGRSLRVALPDDAVGYVPAASVRSAESALQRISAPAGTAIQSRPMAAAPATAVTASDVRLDVLGRFDGFDFVRTPEGLTGWVPRASEGTPN